MEAINSPLTLSGIIRPIGIIAAIALCFLCEPTLAGAVELTIRGLAIGQKFDQEQLQHLLNHMQ